MTKIEWYCQECEKSLGSVVLQDGMTFTPNVPVICPEHPRGLVGKRVEQADTFGGADDA